MRGIQGLLLASVLGLVGWDIYDRAQMRRDIERSRSDATKHSDPRRPERSSSNAGPPAAPGPAAPEPALSAAAVVPDPPVASQKEATPIPSEEERAVQLQNAFDGEPSDPSWAPSTRGEVESSLRERAGTSTIGEVACKSIFCRVRVVHRDAEGRKRFETEMTDIMRRFWKGEMFFPPAEEDPSGSITATIYLLRPGATAPVE